MNVARDTEPSRRHVQPSSKNVPLNEGWRHCFQEKRTYVRTYVCPSNGVSTYGTVGSSKYFEIPQASDPLHISIGSDVTQIREREKTSRAVRAVTSATSHPHCGGDKTTRWDVLCCTHRKICLATLLYTLKLVLPILASDSRWSHHKEGFAPSSRVTRCERSTQHEREGVEESSFVDDGTYGVLVHLLHMTPHTLSCSQRTAFS